MSDKPDGKVEGADAGAAGATGEVELLTNALRFEKAKNDVLLGEVVALEDEVVNRCMADFDAVVSDETRDFWREQLLANREMASAALTELARAKQGLVAGGAGGAGTRRPLHNRSLARPMVPAAVGGGGAGEAAAGAGQADDRAAKIRNRAHEISRADRVPFSAAFRRAERELGAQ